MAAIKENIQAENTQATHGSGAINGATLKAHVIEIDLDSDDFSDDFGTALEAADAGATGLRAECDDDSP